MEISCTSQGFFFLKEHSSGVSSVKAAQMPGRTLYRSLCSCVFPLHSPTRPPSPASAPKGFLLLSPTSSNASKLMPYYLFHRSRGVDNSKISVLILLGCELKQTKKKKLGPATALGNSGRVE
ncbi:putative uncharacterized protein FLJ45831 [Pan paniscus]|uniref:putative uncharacterized protein FLJ45831 n=1 Tax=Pan paniscus TaxID=9597 RepID=UPI0000E24903|nr:putative uncharacterized protein FLJ45831 [Pan paniscus]